MKTFRFHKRLTGLHPALFPLPYSFKIMDDLIPIKCPQDNSSNRDVFCPILFGFWIFDSGLFVSPPHPVLYTALRLPRFFTLTFGSDQQVKYNNCQNGNDERLGHGFCVY